MYPQQVLSPIMIEDEHGLFYKFMNMKPLIFQGIESENDFDFIIDCHERLHKIGIAKNYRVEFISNHL